MVATALATVAAPAAHPSAQAAPSPRTAPLTVLALDETRGTTVHDFGRAGRSTDVALLCDLDGDGRDTPVLYRPSESRWFVGDTPGSLTVSRTFVYSRPGPDVFPLCGDWDGDGVDGVGTWTRSTQRFALRDSGDAGPADVTVRYGVGASSEEPVVGDWEGDGVDTVGVVRERGRWLLRSSLTGGPADLAYSWGSTSDGALVGDWDGDGVDTPGQYGLRLSYVDRHFPGYRGLTTGLPGVGGNAWRGIAGDWDGDGVDEPAVHSYPIWPRDIGWPDELAGSPDQ